MFAGGIDAACCKQKPTSESGSPRKPREDLEPESLKICSAPWHVASHQPSLFAFHRVKAQPFVPVGRALLWLQWVCTVLPAHTPWAGVNGNRRTCKVRSIPSNTRLQREVSVLKARTLLAVVSHYRINSIFLPFFYFRGYSQSKI